MLEEEAPLPEFPALSEEEQCRLQALLEAVLFASPEPVPIEQLARAVGQPPARIRFLLEELQRSLDHPARGLQIRAVAGGFQLSTKPVHRDSLREVLENLPPPAPLSRAALETVAIVALKQPITASNICELRGVRNVDPIRTLLRRKLIAPAGRANTRGHPLRYKTTQRFLVEFGLESLSALRTITQLEHHPKRVLDSADGESLSIAKIS